MARWKAGASPRSSLDLDLHAPLGRPVRPARLHVHHDRHARGSRRIVVHCGYEQATALQAGWPLALEQVPEKGKQQEPPQKQGTSGAKE